MIVVDIASASDNDHARQPRRRPPVFLDIQRIRVVDITRSKCAMVLRQRQRACQSIKAGREQAALSRHTTRTAPDTGHSKHEDLSPGCSKPHHSLQAPSNVPEFGFGTVTADYTPFRMSHLDQAFVENTQAQRCENRRNRRSADFADHAGALRGSLLTRTDVPVDLVPRICSELSPSDLVRLACTTKRLFPPAILSLWKEYHLKVGHALPSSNEINMDLGRLGIRVSLASPYRHIRHLVVHQPVDVQQRLRLVALMPRCPKLEAVSFLFAEGGRLEGRGFWAPTPWALSQLGRKFKRLEFRVLEGPVLIGHLDLPFFLACAKDIRVLRVDTLRAPALVLGPMDVEGEALDAAPILLSSLSELELRLADAMELGIVQDLLQASGNLRIFVFTLPPLTEDYLASALPSDLLMTLPRTLRVLLLVNMAVDAASLYHIRSLKCLTQFAFTPDTDVGIVDLIAYLYVPVGRSILT